MILWIALGLLVVIAILLVVGYKGIEVEEVMPDSLDKYFDEQEHERELPNHNMEGGENG